MAGLQPTAAARPIAQRVYLLAGIFGLALVAAFGFPRLDQALNPGATQPGLISFLGVGLAVLALTAVLLFVGLRGFLPKTAVFIAAAFGYNALLILVKFGLGPLALYATSRSQGFWVLSDLGGYLAFPGLAAITAILYGGAFFLLYLFFRSDLRRRLGVPVRFETRFVVLLLVMFVAFSVTTHGSHLPIALSVLVTGAAAQFWLRRVPLRAMQRVPRSLCRLSTPVAN